MGTLSLSLQVVAVEPALLAARRQFRVAGKGSAWGLCLLCSRLQAEAAGCAGTLLLPLLHVVADGAVTSGGSLLAAAGLYLGLWAVCKPAE